MDAMKLLNQGNNRRRGTRFGCVDFFSCTAFSASSRNFLDETQEPDHSASLGDSIASSTRIRFSVHTPAGHRANTQNTINTIKYAAIQAAGGSAVCSQVNTASELFDGAKTALAVASVADAWPRGPIIATRV
jgi:hypothetical protein